MEKIMVTCEMEVTLKIFEPPLETLEEWCSWEKNVIPYAARNAG